MTEMQHGAKMSTRGVKEGVAKGPLSQIRAFSRPSKPLYGRFSGKRCTPGLCKILHDYANGGGRA